MMANYLDKEKFFNEVVNYNRMRKANSDVAMPNYIGQCIMLICNGLAQRPNFHSYTFIEEMVDDAIEDCVAGIKNFDPAKSNNPYGYCTQVAWFAFVQRIHLEKKQQYLKHKNYQNRFIVSSLESAEHMSPEFSEASNHVISDFERTMEKSLTKTKNKNKIKALEMEKTNVIRQQDKPIDSGDNKKPRRSPTTRGKKPRPTKRAGKSGKNSRTST